MEAVAFGSDDGAEAATWPPRKRMSLQGDLLDALPLAIFSVDCDGRPVQFNRQAVELLSQDTRQRGVARLPTAVRFLNGNTGEAYPESPILEVLRTRRPVRGRSMILDRADGARIPVLVNIDPAYGSQGTLTGAVVCVENLPERAAATYLLSRQERAFQAMIETLPIAFYTTDENGRITYFNEAAVELAGRRPQLGEDRWTIAFRLYRPDGKPIALGEGPMAEALRQNRPLFGCEVVIERPDGFRLPVMPFPTPLHDESGKVVAGVNILIDLSERKQAEELEKRLVDELNHRVKNTLATVQSLAAQTIRGAGINPQLREDFEARLLALSRTHDQLARAHWKGADFGDLVRSTFAPYAALGPSRVELVGPSVRLQSQSALSLGMVLHELAANAAKHGALCGAKGHVRVEWSLAQVGDHMRLGIEWTESGGPAVIEAQRRGFGLRLLDRAVSQQLRGDSQIIFGTGGIRCTIDVPIDVSDANE